MKKHDKYLFSKDGNSYQVKLSQGQLRGMTQCVIIGTQPHNAAQRLQSNEQKHGKTEFQQALLF